MASPGEMCNRLLGASSFALCVRQRCGAIGTLLGRFLSGLSEACHPFFGLLVATDANDWLALQRLLLRRFVLAADDAQARLPSSSTKGGLAFGATHSTAMPR